MMKTKGLWGCALALVLMIAATAPAALETAPPFSEGMVLQRGKPVPVWGTAEAGREVTVRFAGHTVRTRADAAGKWRVKLPPLAANANPSALEIEAPGESRVVLRDVLVGDVWIAGGQSNMEWPVKTSDDAAAEIASASHPLIRYFSVKKAVSTQTPPSVSATDGGWVACSPATVGNFSAVAYFFAREMQRESTERGIPVGIICNAWGGTQIESWLSTDTLAATPAFAPVAARWEQALEDYPRLRAVYDSELAKWKEEEAAAKARGGAIKRRAPRPPPGPGHHMTPGGLYHAMLAPLAPYAITGFLWYQGESNAIRHDEYAPLFEAMIKDWRQAFGQGDIPFYFVQLAGFDTTVEPGRKAWAYLREAQAKALSLPATGMAVAIDVGMPRDVHPTNKQAVGHRLALLARHDLYGEEIEASGPRFLHAERAGAALRLHFANTAGGLRLASPPFRNLEIAGPDGRFHFPAQARVEGDTLLLWSAQVPEPEFVRYAWRNYPATPLANGAGLPAAPFRNDSQTE